MSQASRTAPARGSTSVLVGMAATVVVIAGLKAAAPLILPILVALFLALLCIPPMRRLERHGVPGWLAVVIVLSVAVLIMVLVSAVIGGSVSAFQSDLPAYKDGLDRLLDGALDWLEARRVHLDRDEIASSLDTTAIMGLVGDTASGLLSALSNIGLVLLTMTFMLTEARGVPDKLRRALGDPDADLSDFALAADRVSEYLAIKAWVSGLTGALVGVLCWAVGLDYPLLWALVALLFNFIPNIGSFIAALPAILLALLTIEPGMVALLAAGYLLINVVIGNILEPRVMGQRLGLSTLVVLLSMLFWNWVWGPVGMLLSVPLTVIVKIVLEHTQDMRWLAVLLGPNTPALEPVGGRSALGARSAPPESAPPESAGGAPDA